MRIINHTKLISICESLISYIGDRLSNRILDRILRNEHSNSVRNGCKSWYNQGDKLVATKIIAIYHYSRVEDIHVEVEPNVWISVYRNSSYKDIKLLL